jgi:hypothetical protein
MLHCDKIALTTPIGQLHDRLWSSGALGMIDGGKLRAWIELRGGKIVAAFIGVMPPTWENHRDPATRTFTSPADAKRWVEAEGRAIAVPVEWVKH